MHPRQSPLSARVARVDVVLPSLDRDVPARDVHTLIVDGKDRSNLPAPSPTTLGDADFCTLVASCPSLRVLTLQTWHFDAVRAPLRGQLVPTFSRLAVLRIGSGMDAMLEVSGFFELLSILPALKVLEFGFISLPEDLDIDDSALAAYVQALPAPACSLTHVVVGDDACIDFQYYPQLFSKSHDTLEHLEVHWTFDPVVGDNLRDALVHCTCLRHLTLHGNNFSTASILAVCPQLQALSLTSVPTPDEMKVLRSPLRSLEIAHCYGGTAARFLNASWDRLRVIIPDNPALAVISFHLFRAAVPRECVGYLELRRVCRERRILLSMAPWPRVFPL